MTEQYMDILEKREKEPEWKDIKRYAQEKNNEIIEERSKYCNIIKKYIRLPIEVENNNEYVNKLKDILKEYKENICEAEKPKTEKGLIGEVTDICDFIISALQDFESEKIEDIDDKVEKILSHYIKNEFIVSELDNSYAFRGVSRFDNLKTEGGIHEKEYKNMSEKELSFFRARVVKKEENISNIKDIISLPFSKKNLSNDLRFSSKNEICLYLGVTSYVCSMECNYEFEKNTENKLYLSAFKFNSKGKKLKVLNLALPFLLINGLTEYYCENPEKKFLQNTLIKIMPLVISTSFTIKNEDKNRKKYEYLLSQSIIRVIKKLKIDGVAYLSKRAENDSKLIYEANLAIPMIENKENKEYNNLYDCISCTKPVLVTEKIFNYEGKERSYVNECYSDHESNEILDSNRQINCDGEIKFYKDTYYSNIDDYLVNQEFYELNSDELNSSI